MCTLIHTHALEKRPEGVRAQANSHPLLSKGKCNFASCKCAMDQTGRDLPVPHLSSQKGTRYQVLAGDTLSSKAPPGTSHGREDLLRSLVLIALKYPNL